VVVAIIRIKNSVNNLKLIFIKISKNKFKQKYLKNNKINNKTAIKYYKIVKVGIFKAIFKKVGCYFMY
jgi:hypothetical protein